MRLSALALLLLCGCGPAVVELRETERRTAPRPARGRFYRFRVSASAEPVRVRHDLSLGQIAALPGAAGRGLKTQGLTIVKHSLATHTSFKTATGDVAVSAWFDDVILDVTISSTIIHVPREYPEGSCEYEAVLAHERGHGRYAREHAAQLARELEDALSRAEGLPTRSSPMASTDVAAVADALKASLARIVDPIYARFEKEEAAGQARLDRPDPYEAVYRRCSGWK